MCSVLKNAETTSNHGTIVRGTAQQVTTQQIVQYGGGLDQSLQTNVAGDQSLSMSSYSDS
jgi:hypothetical protein